MKISICLIAAAFSFLCALNGTKGQPNIEIVVVQKVKDYGQNLQLFCKIDKCCEMDAGWTVDGATLFIDIKRSMQTIDPNSKYNATYDDNGMKLIIKNFSRSDLNKTYECTYEFSSVRKYLLYNDVFSSQPNLEIVVVKKVNDYGQNLQLFCKIDNCCQMDAGWTVDGATLFIDIKRFIQTMDSNSKYNATYDDSGMSLIIKNFSMGDLSKIYECTYEFSSVKKALLYDDVFSNNAPPANDHRNVQKIVGSVVSSVVGIAALVACLICLIRYTKCCIKENRKSQLQCFCLSSVEETVDERSPLNESATGTGFSGATSQIGVNIHMENTEANTKITETVCELGKKCYPLTADATEAVNLQKSPEINIKKVGKNDKAESLELQEYPKKIENDLTETKTDRDNKALSAHGDKEAKTKYAMKIESLDTEAKKIVKDLTDEIENLKKRLHEVEEKNTKLEKDLQETTRDRDNKVNELKKLDAKHESLETENKNLKEGNKKLTDNHILEIANLQKRLKEVEEKNTKLEKDLQETTSDRDNKVKELKKLHERLETENKKLKEGNKNLTDNYNSEIVMRKKYYNMVQDMKGKIRVYCRVRPISDSEEARKCEHVCMSQNAKSLKIKGDPNDKVYRFSQVFMENSTQETIFEDTKDLIQSAVDGYNVCIFAYGQTGSGKTHTIIGDKKQNHPGIAPRAFERIFELKGELGSKYEINVCAYMLELYNDSLIDVLAEPGMSANVKLKIKGGENNFVSVEGVVTKQVHNFDELFDLFKKGSEKRHTATTNMNVDSSRSHLIISIVIESTNKTNEETRQGKLSLVDLAGSEGAKAGSNAQQNDEASFINTALHELSNVIRASAKNQQYVPYRNNKLTQLMQDSIGGNAKTLMFVNISPADYNQKESLASLKFAMELTKVTNKASPRIHKR